MTLPDASSPLGIIRPSPIYMALTVEPINGMTCGMPLYNCTMVEPKMMSKIKSLSQTV